MWNGGIGGKIFLFGIKFLSRFAYVHFPGNNFPYKIVANIEKWNTVDARVDTNRVDFKLQFTGCKVVKFEIAHSKKKNVYGSPSLSLSLSGFELSSPNCVVRTYASACIEGSNICSKQKPIPGNPTSLKNKKQQTSAAVQLVGCDSWFFRYNDTCIYIWSSSPSSLPN